MENYATILIPALLIPLLVRVLLAPVRLIWKLAVHAGCGLVCLLLLNTAAGMTGVSFPINAATVLIAGFGGLPAMALMALLQLY